VHEYSDQVVITNYVIFCNGEVKGDILSFRDQRYPGCANNEQKKFNEWIEQQIEKVSEFNHTNYWDSPCNTMVISDCLCSEEEYKTLHEMFNRKYNEKELEIKR
jgi:hypothetical protein